MEGGEGKEYPVSSDRYKLASLKYIICTFGENIIYSLETGENSLHRSTALLKTR